VGEGGIRSASALIIAVPEASVVCRKLPLRRILPDGRVEAEAELVLKIENPDD